MGIINLMDRKKEMRKTPLILWIASLALLMQVQPLCAMDQSETREQKLEKARVKKQEMLRKIAEVSQPQLEKEPQKKVPHELGNNQKKETHIDKLKAFLQSKEFTNVNGDKDKYRNIVKSVESAKVSPEVKQALAKKLLNDTRSILNEGDKVEADFDVLSKKINPLIVREENKYRKIQNESKENTAKTEVFKDEIKVPQGLINREKIIADFWESNGYKHEWRERAIDNVMYRQSEVPGDNDCGVHSLNALFPDQKLSRRNILQRFAHILNNPQEEHHGLLVHELATDLVASLIAGGYIKKSTFSKYEQFMNFINEYSSELAIPYAKKNISILKQYIRFMKDENFLFFARACGKEVLGLLGLACTIYDLDVLFIIHDKTYGKHEISRLGNKKKEPKPLFLLDNHFSPLCLMSDVEERSRLATYHAEEFILKNRGVYKTLKIPSENIDKLMEMMKNNNTKKSQLFNKSNNINTRKNDEIGNKYVASSSKYTDSKKSKILINRNKEYHDLNDKAANVLKKFVTNSADDNDMIRALKLADYDEHIGFDESRYKKVILLAKSKFLNEKKEYEDLNNKAANILKNFVINSADDNDMIRALKLEDYDEHIGFDEFRYTEIILLAKKLYG